MAISRKSQLTNGAQTEAKLCNMEILIAQNDSVMTKFRNICNVGNSRPICHKEGTKIGRYQGSKQFVLVPQ